jgi:hypothetical protein
MTYIRNINHKTKRSSVAAHPSLNNKIVGSNPRSSIFCTARQGLRSSIFFVAKSGLPPCGRARPGWAWVRPAVALAWPGWAWVRPARARCGRPGLAWAQPRPTTTGWDLADCGQGVTGCRRSQSLPPFVILTFFNISLHL